MIRLTHPRANYLAHEAEILRAVRGVLTSGTYVGGVQVEKFEKEFAAYIGVKYAIGVNSGTDALKISMRALGIGPGDEVCTVANTALATIAAIVEVGATPVLGPSDTAIASIPVHLYGHAELLPGGVVIEDCAQACGGYCGNQRLGSFGLFGCFSFYPTKNLGACGDGGMIVTSDAHFAIDCRRIREYGWDTRRVPQGLGVNSRLDPIQAAILRVKLKYLDKENDRRRAIASRYAYDLFDIVEVPDTANHCFHLYVIECDRRDELKKYLYGRNIHTGIHYPVPLHREPIYREHIKVTSDLTGFERRSRRILSLPMYPELTDAEVDEVIGAIRAFYH